MRDGEGRTDDEGIPRPLHCECWGCSNSAIYHSLKFGGVVIDRGTELIALCKYCSVGTRNGKVTVLGTEYPVVAEWGKEEE